ncbi:glycosyltransferase family 4 protein [Marivita sp.]|uniref:glycosyltransferase family 4 protein n=1 Tax=Marivita sp. TaxID=2003365 RepID=UPI0025C42ED2|nr:glycosyltransferase family 4 protein [Marivita sp.]
MKVVRPSGYPARFNTPRPERSRHCISTRKWLPLHKVWQPLEVALIMSSRGSDLIASFNRIPLGDTPFVISFESHLPRLFTYERSAAFRYFTKKLASDRCRAIIPISDYARRTFMKQQADIGELQTLEKKLVSSFYPAVDVPRKVMPDDPVRFDADRPLRVFFVGNHFSRKGGPALLLAAKEAARRNLPVEFHIVSQLTVGGENGVWTDPTDPAFFDRYLGLMTLPNIIHHGSLPNSEVISLLQSCDVSLLPTLSDTFGYSVIESLACGVPVIATEICALPELVVEGKTGHLLHLETDDLGEWTHLFSMKRDRKQYARILTDTFATLSEQIIERLTALIDAPLALGEMKLAAHDDALSRFDARTQSSRLDDLYDSVAVNPR